jgi:cytosine/adenosine deaminase-related metal-dependent hydrolase
VWALWRRLRDRHGVAVHTHALETRAQARLGRERWPNDGMLAAMDAAGLLAEGLSLVHAVWTTPAERALLAERGVAVVHNPASNLTLGSGIMPLDAYITAGVTVGIGTDAANCGGRHDLFEALRLAQTLPRVSEPDPSAWPDASTMMGMATTNGRRILGLDAAPDGIVAGAAADLVLVRRDRTAGAMAPDTLDGFVSHAGRDMVDAVMIAGRLVLRDDRILSFDEGRMLAAVADAHADLAERVARLTPAIDRAIPALAAQLQAWQRSGR